MHPLFSMNLLCTSEIDNVINCNTVYLLNPENMPFNKVQQKCVEYFETFWLLQTY